MNEALKNESQRKGQTPQDKKNLVGKNNVKVLLISWTTKYFH